MRIVLVVSVCVVHLRLCLANTPLSRRGAGSMGLFSERFRHRCRRCHCAARGAGAGALHGFCSVLCALSIFVLHCRAISLGPSARGGGGAATARHAAFQMSKDTLSPGPPRLLVHPLSVPHALDSSCEASETWPIASERPHDDSADMDVRAPSILIGCRRAPLREGIFAACVGRSPTVRMHRRHFWSHRPMKPCPPASWNRRGACPGAHDLS